MCGDLPASPTMDEMLRCKAPQPGTPAFIGSVAACQGPWAVTIQPVLAKAVAQRHVQVL